MSGCLGEAPKKVSEVSKELEILEKTTQISGQVLGDLESRLSSILRTSADCEKEKEVEETLIPLASVIRDIRKKVERLNERVLDIQHRVEL